MKRFWDKVEKTDGCWIWHGAKTANGYGVFNTGEKRNCLAHRYAYEATHGPIPEGMQLDHLCRTRPCVRPDHLEVVDNRTNQLRGNSPSGVHARQTHCMHGHEFTAENTYRRKNGSRECRQCRRRIRRNHYLKHEVGACEA